MFPPASPLTDRVRVQAELNALEREASLYAQTQPSRSSLLKRLTLHRDNADQRAASRPTCVINGNPSAAES